MKDPYLIEHQSYLNQLEDAAAPNRMPTPRQARPSEAGTAMYAMSIVAAIVCVAALVPWGILFA